MFNELNRLEMIIDELLKTDIKKPIPFIVQSGIVRFFEEIGGIGKELKKFGIKVVAEDEVWKEAIKLRDKVSHTYFELDIEMLIEAIADIPYLKSTLPKIKKELSTIK